MGTFIVFEGGDGAGKSIQARALFRRLTRHRYNAILTQEPGGTSLGWALRRHLKSNHHLNPIAELFLFSASRAQIVQEVIKPALSSGQIVICDRYTASTVAYQGYGRGLPLELIERVNRAATGELTADLTILLTIAPKVGLARKKGSLTDSFEAQALDFHTRVQKGYLTLASAHSERWLVFDSSLPVRTLSALIWEQIQPLLRRRG